MTDMIEAVARAMALAADDYEGPDLQWQGWSDIAQAAIAAHTTALIEGAGMLHGRLTAWGDDPEELGHMKPEFAADLLDQAAALIAALRAEIERLTRSAALSDLIAGDADLIDGEPQ